MFGTTRIKFATAGEGGGQGSGQQQQQTDDKGQQQQQQQNNDENNADNFDNLWLNETENKTQQQQQTEQTTDKQQSSQETFDNHIKGINFLEGVDVDKISEDMQTGSSESLTTALKATATNAYKRALVDANSLIESRVQKAVTEAVKQSRTSMNADNAIRLMETKLPFTADRATQPVAQAILAQLMRKGDNVDSAIDKVGKAFKHMYDKAAKDLGINKPPRGPGKAAFNHTENRNSSDESGDLDWMDLLGGEQEE